MWGWDNAIWGASALLASTQAAPSIYSNEIERALGNWINGRNGTVITPKGLAWSNDWGTLRNVANAGMQQGHGYKYQQVLEAFAAGNPAVTIRTFSLSQLLDAPLHALDDLCLLSATASKACSLDKVRFNDPDNVVMLTGFNMAFWLRLDLHP